MTTGPKKKETRVQNPESRIQKTRIPENQKTRKPENIQAPPSGGEEWYEDEKDEKDENDMNAM